MKRLNSRSYEMSPLPGGQRRTGWPSLWNEHSRRKTLPDKLTCHEVDERRQIRRGRP
jgi:hypothetical protein